MARINPNSVFLLMLIISASSCEMKKPTAQEVLDKAIARHGFDSVKDFQVGFDFRSDHFEANLSDLTYELKRVSRSNNEVIEDVINGETFVHKVNNKLVSLDSEKMWRTSSDTRSVIYFALLPYGANDGAMNKQLMPSISIKGEPYFKVEVTYGDNGGGKDFENVFVYWIHQKHFTVDYLAYSYFINGGGVRFREAINPREINGIRFQDYVNYTIAKDFPAHELDYAFQTGQLKEISRIELKDVVVMK
uniref:DUF6503 family protein n=1 Tax=Roseivirga sp. TaxID=1964215 RepID=UPI004047410F